MADPTSGSGEQEESIALLDQHGPDLAAAARAALVDEPDAQLVGLILAPDASEARSLFDAIERATGKSMKGKGFCGLVPRSFALAILRANAPALLDWIEPVDPDGGRLPLLVATRHGFRSGGVDLP